jgi:diguanylate cyclase (GGDEF)-like protein
VALKILDIERFKTINDGIGRQAGDALLLEVVRRLNKVGPGDSWCARLGGDQFAIVTPDVESEEELAVLTGRRFGATFGAPFPVGSTELRISARMGIAVFPSDGSDTDTLLRNAEAALKKAKGSGERFLFYRREMTERIAEKLSLESQLHRALENEEFVLHYQPKIDAASRRIVGLEALIRWQNPELGLVPPIKFIGLLEETGLILDVGSWALRRAALDHRAWAEAGLRPPKVAVNLSAIQLRQRNFVRTLEQAIRDGLSPTGIDLELTESVVMEDIQASMEKLIEVRRLGVGIAVDDFGTGYSSLAYLARLPVETLKIDRSFVKAMDDDSTARTLVQTIISLAHSLRLKVVAEGVETESQATLLLELGCDQMQGYLFAKPLAVAELLTFLRRAS